MNTGHFTRLSVSIVAMAMLAIGLSAGQSLAEDAKPAVPDAVKAHLKRQAIQGEIAAQAEGIHKISDGSICVKSGRGMAIIHADGRGCGTGCNGPAAPANAADTDFMTGIFLGLYLDPQEGAKIGITPERAAKIKEAYNYRDYIGVDPSAVLKIYQAYAKAPEGKAKADAEKALMDKVQAVGKAYVDGEIKKLKDTKALMTPAQIFHFSAMGHEMLHPGDKPVA